MILVPVSLSSCVLDSSSESLPVAGGIDRYCDWYSSFVIERKHVQKVKDNNEFEKTSFKNVLHQICYHDSSTWANTRR